MHFETSLEPSKNFFGKFGSRTSGLDKEINSILVSRRIFSIKSRLLKPPTQIIGTSTFSASFAAKSLRELENDGLIMRCELISAPPKVVEYSLTDFGRELIPALN